MRATGVIRKFGFENGYGFIRSDAGEPLQNLLDKRSSKRRTPRV
jgi:hypothetical protein